MITIDVKLYSSVKDRTVGLIGKDKPEQAMFLTRYGIHTFGLRFSIDAIVLDNNNKVVKLTESLKPNRLFFWPVRYNKVLELPKGYIKEKGIKIGSNISLKMVE